MDVDGEQYAATFLDGIGRGIQNLIRAARS
jgi:hypothetical protein